LLLIPSGYSNLFYKERGREMKILIVDDNQDLAFLIKWMLEDEGYEVRSAKDGMDGYSTYLLFNPDIVLTDIQMPEKNGLELIREIRCHDPDVRTIYMSGDLSRYGRPLEEEKEKYHARVLEKPFSRHELISLVSRS
jgi:DNA-binding response OmpR family regulator